MDGMHAFINEFLNRWHANFNYGHNLTFYNFEVRNIVDEGILKRECILSVFRIFVLSCNNTSF